MTKKETYHYYDPVTPTLRDVLGYDFPKKRRMMTIVSHTDTPGRPGL